jgi:FkbM family methyltransferase
MIERIKSLFNDLLKPNNINYFGCRLYLDKKLISKKIRKIIYNYAYELQEISILSKTLDSKDVVLEIGAGMGFISVFCSKKIGSNSVFAYEANPEMIPLIEKNYLLNNVSPVINNVILDKENGVVDFYVESNFYSSSTIQRNNNAVKLRINSRNINNELKFIKPNFLIIDIEGGEVELMNNILFHENSINKILIEVHPRIVGEEKINSIIQKLFTHNFLLDTDISGKGVLFFYR